MANEDSRLDFCSEVASCVTYFFRGWDGVTDLALIRQHLYTIKLSIRDVDGCLLDGCLLDS